LREGDVGLNSNSEDVLETVDDAVWHGGLGAVTNLQRDTGNVGETKLELAQKLFV